MNSKKIKDSYFVTNEFGGYLILDEESYSTLLNGIPDMDFKRILKDKLFIIDEKNKYDALIKERQKYEHIDKGTGLHIIVTTLRCNLKCVYCQAQSVTCNDKKFDMTMDTAKKTIDFIFQSPAQNITIEFQGGEPTLNLDVLKYIVEYATLKAQAYNKNLEFLLVTNFTTMSEEKLNWLIDNNVNICTSFDGPKQLHDKNRPPYSYDNVIKWTRRFNLEYVNRKIENKVYALITITKDSFKYPEEIIDEYVNAGFEAINIREMTQLGCANDRWKEIGYDINEFIEFWKKCMDYIIDRNKNGIKIKERMICIMLRKILGLEENFVDLMSPCGAAIGQLLYNYDGKIFTCDEARMVKSNKFMIGNIDETYDEVLNKDKTKTIVSSSVNNIKPCNNCVYQPWCGLCPVCNYFEQGKMICNISKTPRCKIYKAMFDYIIEKYFFDDEIKKIFDSWL